MFKLAFRILCIIFNDTSMIFNDTSMTLLSNKIGQFDL